MRRKRAPGLWKKQQRGKRLRNLQNFGTGGKQARQTEGEKEEITRGKAEEGSGNGTTL